MLKVGDKVIRSLAAEIDMPLIVTNIDDEFIYCGPWKFDKRTGCEVDEDLGWGNEHTGSFLKSVI